MTSEVRRFYTDRLKLDEFLLSTGKVTREQLKEAKERQRGSRRPLQDVLIEIEPTFEELIFNWFRNFASVPVVSLITTRIDPEAGKLLSYKYTVSHGVFPYKIEGRDLFVAMSNPLDVRCIDEIRVSTGKNVKSVLSRRSEILKAIEDFHQVDDSLYDVLKNVMVDDDDEVQFVEEGEEQESGTDESIEASSNPIVRLVNLVLSDAVRVKASDIHIEPTEKILFIKYRIDGIIKEIMKLPITLASKVTARIKIMSRLDIAERRIPQDGRAFILAQRGKFDLRISMLPTVYGEKTVIRILDKSSGVIGLDRLQLPVKQSKRLNGIITKPYGLFLVVGPTGSGKSTTLYSILSKINRADNNTITVEDPVEYEVKGINQVQVNVKAGMTFPKAIRSILRQDPDIVMIGEIRDLETAEIAVQASMTGHMVMSTAHTNDAASAITRLTDLGLDRFLIASSILGIIAQRLVRKLCPHCKKEYTPDQDLLDLIASQLPYKDGQLFYRAVGCDKCSFIGYSGRMAVFEILVVSEHIRAQIINGANDRFIMHEALKEGMSSLLMSGIRKVYEGSTSLEEIMRVIEFKQIDLQMCPSCGTIVEDNYFFCTNCGSKLDFHCTNCSALLKKGWKFCKECGNIAGEIVKPGTIEESEEEKTTFFKPVETEVQRPLLLVVDDDKYISKIIKLSLKDMFAQIMMTDNGEEGYRLAQKYQPDLMLLDVMLPGISGFEVCKMLRKSLATTQVPIMMLTAISEEEGQQEGIDVGADDYLTKPFTPAKLKARAEMLLNRSKRQSAL